MRTLEFQQRKLISETWNDPRLSLLESQHIVPFVTSIERYILEAKLTPDQIQQLFTGAEQGMTAGGKNRTFIGKATDAAALPIEAVKFIDKKINELGKALQNSGPVKNMDAKFDELKAKIGAKDSKVVNGIKAVSDWAKANPGKATVAVAILTTAAAMAGGPMGGAIAGFLARATKDLLQGEKLSTAVGKSIKTAAYGAIAGWALRGVGEWLEGLRINSIDYPTVPGLKQVDVGFKHTFEMPGFTSTKDLGSMIVPADKYEEFMGIVKELQSATAGGATSSPAAVDSFYKLWDFAESFDIKTALQDIELNNAALRAITQENDAFLQAITAAKNGIAALAQGSITGKLDSKDVKVKGKPVEPPADDNPNIVRGTESKQFTAMQIETVIEWCDGTPEVLTEGPLDALKKGAAAVGGALKKGAAAVGKAGKNLTTKVTADKLNKAWVKAGSPDDSDKIADILRQAGVSDDVLTPIYKQMGATLPPAPKPAEEPAAQPGAAPAQSGAPGTEPAAAGGQPGTATQGGDTGSTAPAAQGGGTPAAAGPTGKAAPAAAAPMDFKGIQQAVAKLDKAQAQELVKHIDSLGGAAPAAQQPAQGTATPAAGAKAAPAADKNAAAGDTYEKAKGDIRSVQGGAKPIPPKNAADIEAAIAKLAKGDKESGVYAAQKIMNLAKLGVDVKDVQAKWLANSKAGERFLTQSQYFEITKMLREHGLRWSDLGLRIHLVEGTNKYFGVSQK